MGRHKRLTPEELEQAIAQYNESIVKEEELLTNYTKATYLAKIMIAKKLSQIALKLAVLEARIDKNTPKPNTTSMKTFIVACLTMLSISCMNATVHKPLSSKITVNSIWECSDNSLIFAAKADRDYTVICQYDIFADSNKNGLIDTSDIKLNRAPTLFTLQPEGSIHISQPIEIDEKWLNQAIIRITSKDKDTINLVVHCSGGTKSIYRER